MYIDQITTSGHSDVIGFHHPLSFESVTKNMTFLRHVWGTRTLRDLIQHIHVVVNCITLSLIYRHLSLQQSS